MAVEYASRRVRIEDLQSPDMPEKLFELIEGELIELPLPTPRHNRIAFNIERLFGDHCQQHPELDFGGDNDGFVVERNPDSYLVPDASLFRVRPGSDQPLRDFGPEIVVEVMSPSNSPSEMAFKRHRYFRAGTEQFWLVDGVKQQLVIHYRNERVHTFSVDEVFAGEGIATGIEFRVKDIFPSQ